MKVWIRAAIAVSLLAVAGQAAAQAAKEPIDTPLYVGATFGQAHWRPGCAAQPCDDTESALRVLAGYQFNKIFAAEVGYHNLGKVKSPGAFVKANAWEAVALAAWPIAGSLSVYGKLGAYRGAAEDNATPARKATTYSLTGGLGLALDLTRNITLRGEWQTYQKIAGDALGATSDIDVMSIGALWRFR